MAQKIPMCPRCPVPEPEPRPAPKEEVPSQASEAGSEAVSQVADGPADASGLAESSDDEGMLIQLEPPLRPVMKPDITFFGQDLPEAFYDALQEDCEKADLVVVIGSSLKVSPVARIPEMVEPDVPQILINREPLPHMDFNAELLGNCDSILQVGWLV